MKRFARMLFAGLGIVIAASAISLAPHKAATATSGAPVTILNPSLPVTQSGAWNVGITGTPSVNIGTPTVGLAPGSGVNVSNPLDALGNPVPLAASDVDGPARRPFQGFVCVTNTSNFGEGQCFSPPGFVPSGKLLVIEYVNGGCNVPLGKSLTRFLVIAAGGPGIAVMDAIQTPTLIGSDGFSNIYTIDHRVKLYGTPSLDFASTDLTGNTSCSLEVSGYLE